MGFALMILVIAAATAVLVRDRNGFAKSDGAPSQEAEAAPAAAAEGGIDSEIGTAVAGRVVEGLEVPSSETDTVTTHPAAAQLGSRNTALDSFRVRVIDTGGVSVPGAVLSIWHDGYDSQTSPAAVINANSDGIAWIQLAKKTSEVLAYKDGIGSSGLWKVESQPDEQKDELLIELRPIGKIFGQVISSSAFPLPGAQVVFDGVSGAVRGCRPRPLAARLTDASGRFEVDVDAPISLRVVAIANTETSARQLVRVQPGSVEELTIQMASYRIEGVVTGIDTSSLANANVRAAIETQPVITAMCGEDGAFVLDVMKPGMYWIDADVDGYVQDRVATVQLDETNRLGRVTLVMIPAATITGRVTWTNGTPVALGEIAAWPNVDEGVRDGVVKSQTWRRSATIGADGRFELDGLLPQCEYGLVVTDSLSASKVAAVRDVSSGSAGVLIRAKGPLPRTGMLRGVVRDVATGTPVSRFKAEVYPWRGGGYTPVAVSSRWHDDPLGQFEIPTPDAIGVYCVEISADGFAKQVFGPASATEGSAPLEIELGRPGEVHLRVSDSVNGQATDATLRLWSSSPRASGSAHNAYRESLVETPGALTWTGVAPGVYWIEGVSGARRAGPTRIVVADSRKVECQLVLAEKQASGVIQVVLTTLAGEPAEGVIVRVHSSCIGVGDGEGDTVVGGGLTDREGSFRLEVPPGLYWTGAMSGGLFALSGQVFVSESECARVEMQLR